MNAIQKIAAVGAASLATVGSAFAAGPTAGDLSALTPDAASILTAVAAVAGVVLGVTLAIKGFRVVKRLMNF